MIGWLQHCDKNPYVWQTSQKYLAKVYICRYSILMDQNTMMQIMKCRVQSRLEGISSMCNAWSWRWIHRPLMERKLIIIDQQILTMLQSTVGLWFIQTAKYWEGWHITNSQTPSSAFRGQLTNQPVDTCGRGTLAQAPGWLACTGVPKGEGVHSWAVGKLQNNFSLVTGFFIEKDGQNKCVIFDFEM